MTKFPELRLARAGLVSVAGIAALVLSACGGGQGESSSGTQQTTQLTIVNEEAPGAAASELSATADLTADLQAQPLFHLAPVILDAPDGRDAIDNTASARAYPHSLRLSMVQAGLSSQRLTVQEIEASSRMQALSATSAVGEGTAVAMASSSAVTTYTPAQIRAAYGLPALPVAGATLTAGQAAQLGAGQTIYIVDAKHNPNAAAELAAFNKAFGLPTCTSKPIAVTASLPLAAATAADGCVFSVAYSTATGTLSGTAPAYDSGWATEIALDVQWAHAIAPLARIVLIEAPDAMVNSLLGGVKLANRMGPGVVSMSFGAGEGNWTSSVDSAFSAAGMSYLAATGDSGAAVSWPAVSSSVLAVGGTSLSYSGSGSRTETGWSKTGGSTSLYISTPAYQARGLPGVGSVPRRTVADVAFNADPYTGQFVAVMPPGSTASKWTSAGGTSISAPQWAGLIAIANAMRAQASKAVLGVPHSLLYGQIGAVPGNYASVFADITSGSNGTCATCSARTGYDQLTGLGTPNVSGLLTALSSAGAAAAPVVGSSSITGVTGTALSFNTTVTAVNAVSYSLSGAPTGMTISAAGTVSWPKPVAGTYSVTVIAKDSKTSLIGQGVYKVTVTAPLPPAVASASISGKAGTALAFNVSVTASNPVTYTLSGAPSGMTISAAGAVSWAKPVVGTYSVTVTAKDSKTLLSGKGVYTVTIANSSALPVIKAAAMVGVAGKPLTGAITVTDPSGYAMSITITGVPVGITFSMSGQTINLSWAKPVTGNYTLNITVKNSAGLSSKAAVPITITAK